MLADNVADGPVVAIGVLRTDDVASPRSMNAGILMNSSARSLAVDFFFFSVPGGGVVATRLCRSYNIDGAIGTIISLK